MGRTVHDEAATLRIFGRCDDVFAALADELAVEPMPSPPEGKYYTPPALLNLEEDDYVFEQIPYDSFGDRSSTSTSTLNLRETATLVIPSGEHAGAIGEVEGLDREGNVRCRFKLKPKVGKLRAPVVMLVGRWWMQAAVDGAVPSLPVVNKPADDDTGHPAEC